MGKTSKNTYRYFCAKTQMTCPAFKTLLHERLLQVLLGTQLLPKTNPCFTESVAILQMLMDVNCQIQLLYQALFQQPLSITLPQPSGSLFTLNKHYTTLQLYYGLCQKINQALTLLHLALTQTLDEYKDSHFLLTMHEEFTYIHDLLEHSMIHYPHLYNAIEPASV